MTDHYDEGTTVAWNWVNGTGSGKVVETYTERVTKNLGGSEITRNADGDNPAYLIEQEDGAQVLKSHSELSPQ